MTDSGLSVLLVHIIVAPSHRKVISTTVKKFKKSISLLFEALIPNFRRVAALCQGKMWE